MTRGLGRTADGGRRMAAGRLSARQKAGSNPPTSFGILVFCSSTQLRVRPAISPRSFVCRFPPPNARCSRTTAPAPAPVPSPRARDDVVRGLRLTLSGRDWGRRWRAEGPCVPLFCLL